MRFSRIQYLRWVRQMATDPQAPNLTPSGLSAPDIELNTDDLLRFEFRDHTTLSDTLAKDWSLQPEQVILQPGSHWALFLLLAARLNQVPGPVVVEEPCYEPLLRIPQALGAPILRLPRPRATGWSLDMLALDQLSAQKPSVLLLSHPHNPTGACLSADEIDALKAWCSTTGAALISDEVYFDFLPEPAPTPVGIVPECTAVRSFTKAFGLGGLRCSALLGDAGWIAEAAMISDFGPQAVSGSSYALAAAAWEQRSQLCDRARSTAATGKALFNEWVTRMGDLVDVTVADHGIVGFPRLTHDAHEAALRQVAQTKPFGYGLTSATGSHNWISALADQKQVYLVPGGFFEDERAFRVGYGGSPEHVEEGLARLERFVRNAMEKR